MPSFPRAIPKQRKRISELQPGQAVSDDILPISYPLGYHSQQSMDTVQRELSARVLFSRHLRNYIK